MFGLFGAKGNRRKIDVLGIQLPHTISRDSIYFLVTEMFSALQQAPKKVVLDFKKLERIQVGGVAVLSNMIELYKKARIRTEFINVQACGAASFLEGSGFSGLYLSGKSAQNSGGPEFLRLKLVEYSRSHFYLDDELAPWLALVLKTEIPRLNTLTVCFQEIFNNIKDHSTVDVGCSCAHYDEAVGQITICISDFGVGIPAKVRSKIQISSDQGAIAMACQEGFTTKSTPGNMGAGLHVLVRNVVTRNSGSVIICSGQGIYSCVLGPQGAKVKGTGRAAPHGKRYPGTLIYVTLDTAKFVPSEVDDEVFVWE